MLGVYGFVVKEDATVVDTQKGFLGEDITNEEAEIESFLKALDYVIRRYNDERYKVTIYTDYSKVPKMYRVQRGVMAVVFNGLKCNFNIKKVKGDDVRNAHLLCSSVYSWIHPFPGYYNYIQSEPMINNDRRKLVGGLTSNVKV